MLPNHYVDGFWSKFEGTMKLNAKQCRNAGWISLLLIVLVAICQVAIVSAHVLNNETHYGLGSFPFYISLCIFLTIISALCFYRSSLAAVFEVRLGNISRQELKPAIRVASRLVFIIRGLRQHKTISKSSP